MPVTAKLSGKFYERFGDAIANELVDWFNAVDSTYQTQLKEINDLNWTRVESRFGEFDARLDAFEAKMTARMDAFEAKMTARMDAFEAKMTARMDAFESRMDAKFERFRTETVRWMFAFWLGTVLPLAGLELALHGAFTR
jgi:hypothetical protein